MNDETARQRQVLIEIAEGYVSAKIALEAVYPETLYLSIEQCKRYISVERIETFEALIDFWYISDQKEFDYRDFSPWHMQREREQA